MDKARPEYGHQSAQGKEGSDGRQDRRDTAMGRHGDSPLSMCMGLFPDLPPFSGLAFGPGRPSQATSMS
jgi:hypothetical protein